MPDTGSVEAKIASLLAPHENESLDEQIARLTDSLNAEKSGLENIKSDIMRLLNDPTFKTPELGATDDEVDLYREKQDSLSEKRGTLADKNKIIQALQEKVDELTAKKSLDEATSGLKEKEKAYQKASEELEGITPSYKRRRVGKWVCLALIGLLLMGSPFVPGLLGLATGALASGISVLGTGAFSFLGLFGLYKYQEVKDKNKKGLMDGFWTWLTGKEDAYKKCVTAEDKTKKELLQAEEKKAQQEEALADATNPLKRTNPSDFLKRGQKTLEDLYGEVTDGSSDEYWKNYYKGLLNKLELHGKLNATTYSNLIGEATERCGQPLPANPKDFNSPEFWRVSGSSEAEDTDERTA